MKLNVYLVKLAGEVPPNAKTFTPLIWTSKKAVSEPPWPKPP